MTRNIALIGYGAIARAVCAGLGPAGDVRIAQVLVRPARLKDVAAALPPDIAAIDALDDLAPDTDFVMECAGHGAVRDFGAACLGRGIDFGLVSAGALADPATLDALQGAASAGGARCVIVPGAIGGIDALAAAAPALEEVRYQSRKPPASWAGSPAEETHDLAAITAPTVLFESTAREAALRFPKNANVVATVAVAGIGFEATRVVLMADPAASGNSHRITARGAGVDLDYTTSGAALPDNPRTSALTAASVLRCLRHRGTGLQV